jgi:hypothetical protein
VNLQRIPATKALRLQGLVRERDRIDTSIAITRELESQHLDEQLQRLGFSVRQRSWPREHAPVTIGVLRHGYGGRVYRR